MPSEPDGQIEQMLDDAGRDAQPRGAGWDGLRARLARIPQVGPRRVRLWAVMSGVAAMNGPMAVQTTRHRFLPSRPRPAPIPQRR